MKKAFKTVVLAAVSALMLVMFVACADPALKEVAGTYEMTSVSGTVNGVNVTTSMYEYYRIILDEKGNATVQSKAKGGASYEAEGTYKYNDGKIKLTTRSGAAKVTEEMDYEDGVITYKVDTEQMKFTLVLTRVQENEE